MEIQSLLVYIFIYLLIPSISIYRLNKRNENDLYLDIDTTDSLRGMGIIIIMIHHVVQKNSKFTLLYPFLNFGYMAVALFFLLSGYGLTISYKRKKNYMDNFFKNKILKLYFPFLIIYIIFLIFYFFNDQEIIFKEIIFDLCTMSLLKTTTWYIKVQFLMYVVFFFVYKNKHISDSKKANIVFIVTLIYILMANLFHLKIYWYITVIFFAIGVYLVEYKQDILKILKKYSKIIFTLSLIIFIGITLCMFLYGNLGVPFTIIDIITIVSFNLMILSLTYNIKLNSIFLKFVGRLSLEIYLIHGMVLSNQFLWDLKMNNVFEYILLFIISIFLAWTVKNIENHLI